MSSIAPDRARLARLEEAQSARYDLAWVLLVLAAASAVAGRVEPPLGSFWDWAAVIAAGASAFAGAAALGARRERDRALDAWLIAASPASYDGRAAMRACRIGSPRARAGLATRLEALVVRSGRGGRAECFQTGLVRMHAARLCAVARRLRAGDRRSRQSPASTGSW